MTTYPMLTAVSEALKRLGRCACCETQATAMITIQFSRIHGDGASYEVDATHLRLAQSDVRAFLQRVQIRGKAA